MDGDALADIGEGLAPADRAGPEAGAEGQDRDLLAGVVGAAPGRVVAVVGGQHGEIAEKTAREIETYPGHADRHFAELKAILDQEGSDYAS